MAPAQFQASGRTFDAQAVGRDAAPASVDQPEVVDGGWVRDGGVVVEAAFAKALKVNVGDRVTVAGRAFEVVGIAVSRRASSSLAAACSAMPR